MGVFGESKLSDTRDQTCDSAPKQTRCLLVFGESKLSDPRDQTCDSAPKQTRCLLVFGESKLSDPRDQTCDSAPKQTRCLLAVPGVPGVPAPLQCGFCFLRDYTWSSRVRLTRQHFCNKLELWRRKSKR